jgi:hypothetical protein
VLVALLFGLIVPCALYRGVTSYHGVSGWWIWWIWWKLDGQMVEAVNIK